MIRLWLDRLYLSSGYLAGMFLMAIGLTIVAQVVGRLVGVAIDSTEISGFCLATSSFLGLAYTFHSGSHIRINMLIRNLVGPPRRVVELWCCGVGAVVFVFFSYHVVELFWLSFTFGDRSRGLFAIPLWIPQIGMVIGVFLLAIGFIDEFIRVARGQVPSYEMNVESVLDMEALDEHQTSENAEVRSDRASDRPLRE